MNGILFKDSMIQAIIEGRKTQTRRIIKFHKPFENPDSWEVIYPDGGGNWIAWDKDRPGLAEFTKKAYPNGEGFKSKYHIGQKLYIKEAWELKYDKETTSFYVQFNAFSMRVEPPKNYLTSSKHLFGKKSPLFMPAWAARYFIEITNVEPQRLQEITEEDCIAEGVLNEGRFSAVVMYAHLWNSINKDLMWASNPYVWKYTFKQVK